MRVGIVGLGYRLAYLARVFSATLADFRVAAHVDPQPAGLECTSHFGIPAGKTLETRPAAARLAYRMACA